MREKRKRQRKGIEEQPKPGEKERLAILASIGMAPGDEKKKARKSPRRRR